MPDKTDPPLIIHTDTMLAFTISSESLKAISGRNPQVIKSDCCVEHLQLPECGALDLWVNPPHPLLLPDPLRVLCAERPDHTPTI